MFLAFAIVKNYRNSLIYAQVLEYPKLIILECMVDIWVLDLGSWILAV